MKTRWAPLAPLAAPPGVLPGSFTGLAAVGVLVGLAAQAAVLALERMPVARSSSVARSLFSSGLQRLHRPL